MMIVDNIGLCRLGGFVGSNPKLISAYPSLDLKEKELQDLLAKCLPYGIEPNSFFSTKFKKKLIFSYVFPTRGEDPRSRNDLVSLIVIVNDNKVVIRDFEILFKIIIEKMIKQQISTSLLKESLGKIYEGINLEKKFKIKEFTIEPSKIINKKKLTIRREKEKLEGRFL